MNILRRLSPPRRWLQIRLRTVFVLGTALCIYFAWPHLMRQYAFWRLCQIGDRDFDDLWVMESRSVLNITTKSNKTEEIQKLIRRFLPPRSHLEQIIDKSNPWMVRRIRNGRARLMIVIVRPPFGAPGSGDVQILLIDRFGQVLGNRKISTGNRFFPTRMAFGPTEHGLPCVRIACDYFWVGLTQEQQIAIRDSRIALVREILRNEKPRECEQLLKEYHQLGPDHRFADHSAWSAALMSSDDIDVLEALLHLPPAEAIEKRDPAEIGRLESLARSADAWIREGAVAALAEYRN